MAIALAVALATTACDDGGSVYGDGGGPTAWTAIADSAFGTANISAIAYGSVGNADGRFVAVGSDSKMTYSDDGETWTAVSNSTFDPGDSISSIAYVNNRFFAGGENGKMAYSDDGETWTAVSNSAFVIYGYNSFIRSIAYGNNGFVAVGDSVIGYNPNTQPGRMAYSTNGTSWTAVSTNITFGDSAILGIAYGNGKFVAVGENGKMAYSDDGKTYTWTAVSDSTFGSDDYIRSIAYGNGKFVAVGDDGKMATSPDGVTWTAVYSTFGTSGISAITYGEWVAGGRGFKKQLADKAFAYSKHRFVAVGSDGKMAYSTNGTSWTAIANSTFGTANISAIAYGNGKFVAGYGSGKMAYADW